MQRTRFMSGDFELKVGEAPKKEVLLMLAALLMHASMGIRESADDETAQIPEGFSINFNRDGWDICMEMTLRFDKEKNDVN